MDDWFISPTVDEDGNTIIVTGRLDVEKFRSKDKYSIRVEVTLPYTPEGPLGFPAPATAELMEQATDALQKALKGKNTAIMTGIFTGGAQRNWVFYTFSTEVFGSYLNRALAELPVLPLEIYAENDPDWAAYDEMIEESYNPDLGI
ncbi:MAG: DUF695 domain-containing protein [Muribaculaceae bacterium]|nr:DUF695 domain-containing protein [Muribaculaceae bacterium]